MSLGHPPRLPKNDTDPCPVCSAAPLQGNTAAESEARPADAGSDDAIMITAGSANLGTLKPGGVVKAKVRLGVRLGYIRFWPAAR